jgi:hypothetical protein
MNNRSRKLRERAKCSLGWYFTLFSRCFDRFCGE